MLDVGRPLLHRKLDGRGPCSLFEVENFWHHVISEQEEVQTDVQVNCLARVKMAEKQHMPQVLMGYWSDWVPVHYKMIKASYLLLNEFYKKIFNLILSSGVYPIQLCNGLITPIFSEVTKIL